MTRTLGPDNLPFDWEDAYPDLAVTFDIARTMIKKEEIIRKWLDLQSYDWLTGEAAEMEKIIRVIARLGDRRYSGPLR